ncbi:MAG: GNAT family N-acetyltransferase [Dehalococcoidia bacterium]|nr:GNAT family N-acetyltransferase [Dehalococcoidia bacterium]
MRPPLEILDLHVQALFKLDEFGRTVASNTLSFESAPRFYIGRAEGEVVALVRQDVPAPMAADMLELASSEPPHTSPRTPPRFAGNYYESLAEDGPIERNYFGPAYWLPPSVVVSPPEEARLLTEADGELLAPHFAWALADIQAGQPVFGVIRDGAVVAQCSCSRRTKRVVEAGIEVVEAYRGAGFAKDCTRAWVREMRERDLIPLWSTTWENEASQAIAARLGFEMYGTDWHLA